MDKPEQDAYGRMAYRGLIAWPERLQREAPLLLRALGAGPSRRVLDLGCGSGEHSRFLAAQGFEVTGLDASASQVQAAQEADPQGRYLQASLTALPVVDLAPQGGALCVGNTLPHLCEEADLRAFFTGLAGCLEPGAAFLLQLLNYDRILDRGERTFPLVLRPGAAQGEDTLFLRLMTHHGDGRLTFTPATLRHHPGAVPPLELLAAEEVALRGWRRAEVETQLQASGFRVRETLGTMTGEAWSPTSSDLVILAERA
jgi:SAM-dependent methyltransferase